jgi:hypothetical protein
VEKGHFADECARRGGAVAAIRYVLGLIASGELVVSSEIVEGLGVALDGALQLYAEVASERAALS